jgi:hypothetical protein
MDAYVNRGIGELHIGQTEDGAVGIWDHAGNMLGSGNTVEEAAMDAEYRSETECPRCEGAGLLPNAEMSNERERRT